MSEWLLILRSIEAFRHAPEGALPRVLTSILRADESERGGLRSAPRSETNRLAIRSMAAAKRSTLAARIILETLIERHAEHDCHFKGSLERRRIFVLFYSYDGLPCHPDLVGECLLRHLAERPEFSNPIAYGGHQSAFR